MTAPARHVVVLGGGGREQAIAHHARAHGHLAELVGDADELLLRGEPFPDLVIVGPEALLAAGAAQRCAAAGIACFGPTAELARIESSKGYARDLARDLGIPGPWFARCDTLEDALAAWRGRGAGTLVVKQDGLAAGKGVIVPADAAATEEAIRTLAAHGPVVLEERLDGPEVTLLAMCDGRAALALPLAEDHKRLLPGDRGPNTGGMGAVCPVHPELDPAALLAAFVQPVLDHFSAAGTPYVGVLYASLMLTADGPRLIEYNCRFGDPEAQAVLAVVDEDLVELAWRATRGELGQGGVAVRPGFAVTIVAAAEGYPGEVRSGDPITIDGHPCDLSASVELDGVVIHPAAASRGAQSRTAGGRVLSVTAHDAALGVARQRALDGLARIEFPGAQLRTDIGWRAHAAAVRSYAEAGVDIDEGSRAVARMSAAVRATYTADVLHGVGSFGGALRLGDSPTVLVASTDGVGTKVELAARAGRHRGVGIDIVNHCIDDVLVQGARPLFFLDYVAAARLRAETVAEIVEGAAEACRAAGCVLLGGETAEMPGVYHDGAFDIAGTLVGSVQREDLLPRDGIRAGDALIGLASSGPHTNGYSLLRRLFEWLPLDAQPEPLDRPLIDALLEPHRSYLDVLGPVLRSPMLKGMAHITGGGLAENVVRILPEGVGARIDTAAWPRPPLFELVHAVARGVGRDELYRTLNMGIGMVLVTDSPDELAAELGEKSWVIGELVEGERRVMLR